MAKATLGYASRTEAVQALRVKGMTTRAIAEKIGIEPKTVGALEASARRRENGGRNVSANKGWPLQKLTPDQVLEIAEKRESGWSYQRLADKFGIKPGAVHYHCLKQGAISPRTTVIRNRGPMVFTASDGRVQRRFTPEEDARLQELAMEGLPAHKIAPLVGRAITSVRMRLLTLAAREDGYGTGGPR